MVPLLREWCLIVQAPWAACMPSGPFDCWRLWIPTPIAVGLDDPEPRVREQAVPWPRPGSSREPALVTLLLALAG